MSVKKKTQRNGGKKPNMQLENEARQDAMTDPTPSAVSEDEEALQAMGDAVESAAECQPEEAFAQEKAEAQAQTVETELAEALAAANAKTDEYLTLAQRVQADFDNYRRRNQNVRSEAFEDGARAFIVTLLPVLDNLERAIGAADANTDKALLEGVQMVSRQLSDAFAKRGVTPIDRKGEKFDPNLENAVLQGASGDGEPGTVCEVLQKGYQMGGYVLRHAMVKVVPD